MKKKKIQTIYTHIYAYLNSKLLEAKKASQKNIFVQIDVYIQLLIAENISLINKDLLCLHIELYSCP